MSSPSTLEAGRNQKRTAVKVHGTALALLSFQTLGIIYSDIGTSPLYVLNGIWPASGSVPSEEDIIGGVSAIVWALTILPLIKYVFITLHFGTHEGEGGTFALFQGLYPPEDQDSDLDRTLTGDSSNQPKSIGKHRLRESFRWPLLVWCLFGTSLTIADGIFTPAVSVTSAVAGIAVAKPSVTSDTIPISIAILVVLFLAQRFGTAKLAFLFAPVAFIWFLLLIGTGIYNITFHPGIFRAFDPSRAVMLFVRTKDYDILAGVLLAITGCEAVFANLGHFNALSIQISFSTFVYPALVLAYLGQGARLIVDGETVLANVFYQTIPGPPNGALYWIVFVFAIAATIIASQALITATFSLIQQIVNMKGLPPIRMYHTSETIQGQIYIPAVNWALMIVTIIIVGTFKSSTALTNAYGFSVATVMFSTSVLIAVHIPYVKHLPYILGIAYFIVFGFFDGLFWGAALKKIPQGAWVPLMIGVILMSLMIFWTWAKGLEDTFDGANRKNLRHFIHVDQAQNEAVIADRSPEIRFDDINDDASEEVHEKQEQTPHAVYYYMSSEAELAHIQNSRKAPMHEKRELARIPTCAIFHKIASGKGVPHSFIGFIRQWPALPRITIFLSVRILPVPRVSDEERYIVDKVRSVSGVYGVTYYIGFRDKFEVKMDDLVSRICSLEIQANPRESSDTINEIQRAVQTTTHIVPHYHVSSRKLATSRLSAITVWVRAFLIEEIYRRLITMFPETANWNTSADEIIHVGINAAI